MKNKAFWRAAHSLGHPLTIISIVLLLVNDHWLRIESPSWWTGKIGDFAWLIFAPLICALVFAWIIPRRTPNHEKWVGIFSFAFIGLWFATAKTIPAIHALTTSTLDSLVGWPGSLRMDVTDLITLPALLIGWHIWQNAHSDAINARPLAWVMLALGVVSTVATSYPMPNYGIAQLCEENGELFAFLSAGDSFFPSRFSTSDGGLTWQEVYGRELHPECRRHGYLSHSDEWRLIADSQTYEFVPGEAIYRSENGHNREMEVNLSELDSDLRRSYYQEKSRSYGSYSVEYSPGPFDALIDTKTGNLVVAMGHDGGLVRTKNGHWQWVSIGPYHKVDLNQIDLPRFLQPEILTALLLFILIPPTITLLTRVSLGLFMPPLIIAWLIWLAIFVTKDWFIADIFVYPTVLLAIITIALNALVVKYYFSHKNIGSLFVMLILVPLCITSIFLLPYILWVRGTVPNYTTARTFALVLCYGGVFAGGQYLKHRFPSVSNLKEVDTSSNV